MIEREREMKFQMSKFQSLFVIVIPILSLSFLYFQLKKKKRAIERKNDQNNSQKNIFQLLEEEKKEINETLQNKIISQIKERSELASQIDSKGRLLLHIEVMKPFPNYQIGQNCFSFHFFLEDLQLIDIYIS